MSRYKRPEHLYRESVEPDREIQENEQEEVGEIEAERKGEYLEREEAEPEEEEPEEE